MSSKVDIDKWHFHAIHNARFPPSFFFEKITSFERTTLSFNIPNSTKECWRISALTLIESDIIEFGLSNSKSSEILMFQYSNRFGVHTLKMFRLSYANTNFM